MGVAVEEMRDGVLLLAAARAEWGRGEANSVSIAVQRGAVARPQLCQSGPRASGKGLLHRIDIWSGLPKDPILTPRSYCVCHRPRVNLLPSLFYVLDKALLANRVSDQEIPDLVVAGLLQRLLFVSWPRVRIDYSARRVVGLEIGG